MAQQHFTGEPAAAFGRTAQPGLGRPLDRDEARKARRLLTVIGVLAVLGGICAILVPAVASVTVAIFIGWVLVFAGVLLGWDAFTQPQPSREAKVVRIVEAVLALLAGLSILLFPLTGTLTLTFFLAAWFLASGVVLLWAWWRTRGREGAGWLAAHGGLALLLGLLITLDLPSSAGWALGLLVGVHLLFFGVRTLVASRVLKQLFEG